MMHIFCNMNLAEQMQAQIALNKVLPLIQMQLANNSFILVDYFIAIFLNKN